MVIKINKNIMKIHIKPVYGSFAQFIGGKVNSHKTDRQIFCGLFDHYHNEYVQSYLTGQCR